MLEASLASSCIVEIRHRCVIVAQRPVPSQCPHSALVCPTFLSSISRIASARTLDVTADRPTQMWTRALTYLKSNPKIIRSTENASTQLTQSVTRGDPRLSDSNWMFACTPAPGTSFTLWNVFFICPTTLWGGTNERALRRRMVVVRKAARWVSREG
jgi:hypothetical protein